MILIAHPFWQLGEEGDFTRHTSKHNLKPEISIFYLKKLWSVLELRGLGLLLVLEGL